jgi:isocitrate dehydrogenase (NAD+)
MTTPPTVTLLRGDGVSGELMAPVLELLTAAGARVTFDEQPAGRATSDTLPAATLASIRANGVALKGKLLSPPGDGHSNPNADLRKRLDLFAAVRPLKNLPGLCARHDGVDVVVIRETTEDIYAGLEHTVSDGIIGSLRVVTERACERIARYAFGYAKQHGRKKVTLVHKANIMKVTDGLFIAVADRVAADYPDIQFNKLIIDNACMQLVMRPHQYDVILAGNMYGDIMSDLGAGIVGGISATYGFCSNDKVTVFEALHGDAPELIGTGKANPLPLLMPACALLEHLQQPEPAARIRAAITAALQGPVEALTRDLGGSGTTQTLIDAIRAAL